MIGSESIGQLIQRTFEKQDSIQTINKKMIFKAALDKKIHLINLKGKESIEELRKAIAFSFKLPSDSFEMSYLDEDGDQITLSDAQDFSILTSNGQKIMKVKVQELKKGSQVEVLEDNPDKESVKDESMEVIQPLRIEERREEIKQEVVEVKQELIEEKFRKFLPEIISRVKSEIQEEISERSRVYDQNQPLIIEDEEKVILTDKKEQISEPKIEEQEKNSHLVVHKGVTCDSCGKKDIEGIRYKCAVCANFDFCEQCESSIEHSHPFLKIRTLKQTPIKVFAIISDEDNNFEVNGHRIPCQGGFQNLVQRGISFVNNFMNNQRSNQRQTNCPFFRNRFGCQRRQEEKQEEEKPKKMQEKTETEVKPAEKKQKEEQISQVAQERLIENARYLSDLGFEFDKCYQWASTYPKLSKEELVDFCLSTPGFLN